MQETTIITINDNKNLVIKADTDKILKILEKELSNIYNQNTEYHSVLDGKGMNEIEKRHHRKTIKKIIDIKIYKIIAKSTEKAFEEFAMNDDELLKITHEIMKEELGEDIEETIANILLKHFLKGMEKWLNIKEGQVDYES